MTKEDMKKTYMKPVSETVNTEVAQGYAIDIISSPAVSLDEDKKINGGDALVKDGGAWDTDGLWN